MKKTLTLFAFLLFTCTAHARTIDDAVIPETLAVTGEQTPLRLNGAGLRTRYFVKVYVAALYVAEPATRIEQVLESRATRVMAITMRRNTDSEQIATAFLTSVARNHDKAEMKALQERLTQFKLLIPSLKHGEVLRLEFLPNGDTRIQLGKQPLGKLTGADFQRALLKIWFGSVPVSEELKQQLLGAQAAGPKEAKGGRR